MPHLNLCVLVLCLLVLPNRNYIQIMSEPIFSYVMYILPSSSNELVRLLDVLLLSMNVLAELAEK